MSTQPATSSKVPSLAHWNCYANNGKHSYDIEADSVKYMINPVFANIHGKLIGYSLSSFHQSETMAGYLNVIHDGNDGFMFHRYNGQVPTFSRADSAAKAARLAHPKRPK